MVAIDPDDRTVEIQYFDGTIEELDLEEWPRTSSCPPSRPSDWTGSLHVEPEDTENEYEAEPNGQATWGDPLKSLDRGEVSGYSELEMVEIQDEGNRY